MIRTALLPAALCLALSACSTWPLSYFKAPVTLNQGFGNTVRSDWAMQIVNPNPVYAGFEIPDMDGARAMGAIERYKGSNVFTPEAETTTQ